MAIHGWSCQMIMSWNLFETLLITYSTRILLPKMQENKSKQNTHIHKNMTITITLILICFCWNMKKKSYVSLWNFHVKYSVLSLWIMHRSMLFSSLTQTRQQTERAKYSCCSNCLSLALISFWLIATHLWIFACFMSRTHAATLKAKCHNMKGRFLINVTSFAALSSSHFAWVSC